MSWVPVRFGEGAEGDWPTTWSNVENGADDDDDDEGDDGNDVWMMMMVVDDDTFHWKWPPGPIYFSHWKL